LGAFTEKAILRGQFAQLQLIALQLQSGQSCAKRPKNLLSMNSHRRQTIFCNTLMEESTAAQVRSDDDVTELEKFEKSHDVNKLT